MSLEARLITVRGNSLIENATNQAMIQSVSSGSSPALIFYEMTPSVSIGRSQHSALDVDVEACRRNNVALARRNSGGQAVYIDNNYIESLPAEMIRLTNLKYICYIGNNNIYIPHILIRLFKLT